MAPVVKEVGDGDIISRMKAKGRNILILYGSQTGTAEDFSSNLARDAQRYEDMKVYFVISFKKFIIFYNFFYKRFKIICKYIFKSGDGG